MPAPTQAPKERPQILAAFKQKLAQQQLPVLRKTVARIVSLASNFKSDVGELAQTILQDQSFTARVLAVANSPYYRGGTEPITTITRAIVQIGYTTLRDIAIAAEFTEMAQKRLPQGINLQRLLAKALVAAQQAKALGEAIGIPEAEELFTSTLLQNIGEFSLAYFMPKEYQRIEGLMETEGVTYEAAHQQVLGITPGDLTSEVMKACQLPEELVARAPDWAKPHTWTGQDRKQAVVVIANETTATLFGPQTPGTSATLNGILMKAGKALKLPAAQLEKRITDAFGKACSLGKSLDIDPACFLPRLPDQGAPQDGARNSLIESCVQIAEPLVTTPAEPPPPPPPDSIGSASLLVSFLNDLSNQVMTSPDFNTVLTCVLEGLHRAVGFDHAVVLLAVPGKPLAVGRYGVGPNAPALLPSFAVSTEQNHNLLAHCMAIRTPMRLKAAEEPEVPLPPSIMDAIKPTAIALGPLHIPARSIGLIWADRVNGDIDDPMWNAFQLFLMQANLALLRLSTKS
jgi:HD-like signal output (HDOD) protein